MRIVIRESNKVTVTAEGQSRRDLLDLSAAARVAFGESVHAVLESGGEGPEVIFRVHPILGLITLA